MAAQHHEACVLVGATATGKTAVAHLLAAQLNAVILSADSMLVYRDMDIGTAKPAVAARAQFSYGGLDLVDPDAEFQIASWLEHARKFLEQAHGAHRPVIVVGGTGLYVKCLLTGLTAQPAADPGWRAVASKMTLAELQRQLQQLDAARFAAMTESDQKNPRRLIRAIERARDFPSLGKTEPSTFQALENTEVSGQFPVVSPMVVGLQLPPLLLAQRIGARVAAMFDHGLLAEARLLRDKFPQLSTTAQQAIGYAEAFAVLDGLCDEKTAREKIAVRTRQLAKRQMTWFKHQVNVAWVAADAPVAAVAARVRKRWSENGPTPLAY